jgi:hypothetical protein
MGIEMIRYSKQGNTPTQSKVNEMNILFLHLIRAFLPNIWIIAKEISELAKAKNCAILIISVSNPLKNHAINHVTNASNHN